MFVNKCRNVDLEDASCGQSSLNCTDDDKLCARLFADDNANDAVCLTGALFFSYYGDNNLVQSS